MAARLNLDHAYIRQRAATGTSNSALARELGCERKTIGRIVNRGTRRLPEPARCRDCGERLDRPHPLGAHLPGCAYDVIDRGGAG